MHPIAVRLGYVALGAGISLGTVAVLQRPKPGDISAVPELIQKGYVGARMKEPTIPELPKGAKPVAVVEGEVRYEPVPEEVARAVPLNPVTFPAPCDLDAIEVDIRCRAELVEAGGVYLGRTIVSGTLEFGGVTRTLPETIAGQFDPVDPEAKPTTVTISPSVRQRKWDLGALAGVSYGDSRPGIEAGLTWRRGWLGGYVLGEYLPPTGDRGGDWRGHGGVRVTW